MRTTRRQWFRHSATAAAALAAGGALAGCASGAAGSSGAGPAPTVQQAKIILGMRAWGVGSGAVGSPKTIDGLLYDATKPWRDQHPGVDIRIIENQGGPQAVITSIIAGDGPDIYHSWHPDVMFGDDFAYAADLTKYLRQTNSDLTVFNKAQMNMFATQSGVRALPYYLGIMTLAVNLGLLDSMGLTYPGDSWTYEDYAKLATSIARGAQGSKQKVYGADFAFGMFGAFPNLPPTCVFEGFGGSYVVNGDPAHSNLDAAGSVRAVNWAYDLARAKVLTPPGGGGDFTKQTLGMTWAPSFFLPQAATGWTGFKWRYNNMPAFPATGPSTLCTSDLWCMNAQSKNPDLAWDLLHWCAFEPDWQRSQMDIFLLSPALLSLWDEWLTRVPNIAPPLADKNLKAFADLARGNQAYPKQFMRYSAPQAETLIDGISQQMWAGKLTVEEGLRQAAAQVDALEQASVVESQAAAQKAKAFPASGSAIAVVPAGI